MKVSIQSENGTTKTIEAKADGTFSAPIGFNNVYTISMSMEFHGTSRVLVDTRVPERVSANPAGGVIEFACDLFESYEGLNMGALKKPLMKVSFNEKKNRFEFDKAYSENVMVELEGFLTRSEQMKLNDAPVKQANTPVAAVPKPEEKKERKIIEFEAEKEDKKVVENARGSRNIMDEPVEEEKKTVRQEEVPIIQPEVKIEPEIVLELEDEEPTDALTISDDNLIVPQRIELDKLQLRKKEVEKESEEKIAVQAVQEIQRANEEVMMREKIREYNLFVNEQKQEKLVNREAQVEMFRSLVETVAYAEVSLKKEYYVKHPLKHSSIDPDIAIKKSKMLLVDEERITISYPDKSKVFMKEIWPFGITYYYLEGSETDKNNYCNTISSYSKNRVKCSN